MNNIYLIATEIVEDRYGDGNLYHVDEHFLPHFFPNEESAQFFLDEVRMKSHEQYGWEIIDKHKCFCGEGRTIHRKKDGQDEYIIERVQKISQFTIGWYQLEPEVEQKLKELL